MLCRIIFKNGNYAAHVLHTNFDNICINIITVLRATEDRWRHGGNNFLLPSLTVWGLFFLFKCLIPRNRDKMRSRVVQIPTAITPTVAGDQQMEPRKHKQIWTQIRYWDDVDRSCHFQGHPRALWDHSWPFLSSIK